MKSIKVKSSLYNYEVEFIKEISNQTEFLEHTSTFVIDRNVYNLYEDLFAQFDKSKVYFIDAVEDKKNIFTVLDIINFWKQIGVKKNWSVFCFGGGITQDLTTFASNIYLRNIDWYFFPTTLLAMSDSCIGGKCGINLEQYKNQLGVFYPPKKIYIYKGFLDTLSEEDYINGWGELLKFSLTENVDFFHQLENEKQYIPCSTIDEYIYKGLCVKKNIIELDEFEGDLRRVLNYGHTFGHALEAYTKNEIPHGKAVIWGMDVANYISYKLGVLDKEVYYRIKRLIKNSFIRNEIIINRPTELFNIIKTDKKVKDNTLYMALLDKLSHLIIYPIEINEELEEVFVMYLEKTHEYYCN